MPSPNEMAATMLRNLPEKTGKSLSGWHQILKKSPLQKHGELISLLKKEHGVTHGFANLISYPNSANRTVEALAIRLQGNTPVIGLNSGQFMMPL